ncbi:MAG: hypothetical protein KatS3mg104_1497 [Phycisphaerae bacterium]|nr:MAG: hypothetical protein KatS3mg104_1497 [Phycisphaerae bacterium]
MQQLLGVDQAILKGYCRALEQKLADGPLSLSDRDRLIARGMRLGLKRFDANLVLAAMEHRCQQSRLGLTDRLEDISSEPDSSPLPRWLAWGTALAVQGMIMIGLWWVMR